MENSERYSILSECRVWPLRSTPVAPILFETCDAFKVTTEEVKFFPTFVAKILYLAKKVRPEGLVALTFLTSKLNEVGEEDIRKLRRLLGYLRATPSRGMVFRIGNDLTVAPLLMQPMRCIKALGSRIPAARSISATWGC